MSVEACDVDGELFTISPDDYISRDFLTREKQHLWKNVWQVACREEEIKAPGDYITYDIGDESIIVARNGNGAIVAYHNVCPHRGRRLAKECGVTKAFRCGYHGWTFDLSGKNTYIQDKDDWRGALDARSLDLHPVRVDTWGGFVWVDLRKDGETLAEYLETVPDYLNAYEYEHMRFRWYLTIHMKCNWKVALEAFMENYHVATTHPQILPYVGEDYSQSFAHGKHAHFGFWKSASPLGVPSPRLNRPWPDDSRDAVMRFFEVYEEHLKGLFSDRDYRATRNLKDVVPEGADPSTAFMMAVELGRKAAEAEGIGYPAGVTWEHLAKSGANWHIFPNCATLPWFDGALFYRARPEGDDPDRCIFDVWSLVRYAPGTEPALERRVFKDMDVDSAGGILDQDFSNLPEVQKGMKSSAFREILPNPVQEMEIINFHRTLYRYLGLD